MAGYSLLDLDLKRILFRRMGAIPPQYQIFGPSNGPWRTSPEKLHA